jgi:hypothetical protein
METLSEGDGLDSGDNPEAMHCMCPEDWMEQYIWYYF